MSDADDSLSRWICPLAVWIAFCPSTTLKKQSIPFEMMFGRYKVWEDTSRKVAAMDYTI